MHTGVLLLGSLASKGLEPVGVVSDPVFLSPLHDGVGDDIGVVLVDVVVAALSGLLDGLVAIFILPPRTARNTCAWGPSP